MTKRLQGKTACVTGASRGVGAAIACAFAHEGANLLLVSAPGSGDDLRQVEQRCKSEGAQNIKCYEVDLADPQACDAHCAECCKQGIDVLVNNAGLFGDGAGEQGPLKGDPAHWDKMMRVNLNAPMRLTRHVAPAMADKGEGWIINIGDVEGWHTGAHHPAYAASKHGLRGWSMSCYEALRDKNIKVTLVSPGNVKSTAMQEETGKGEGGQGQIMPEDVAEACLFPFHLSGNCVPEEIVLKAVRPAHA